MKDSRWEEGRPSRTPTKSIAPHMTVPIPFPMDEYERMMARVVEEQTSPAEFIRRAVRRALEVN
jgi:hypothetical protein